MPDIITVMKPLRLLIAVAALLFSGVVAASPADAGSLQFTSAYCYQTDDAAGLGAPFECDYVLSGVVGSLTLASYRVTSGRLKSESHWGQYADVVGYGQPETTVTVTVTYRDSSGATATTTNSLDCHWTVYQ